VKIIDLSVPIMNYSMDTHQQSPVAQAPQVSESLAKACGGM